VCHPPTHHQLFELFRLSKTCSHIFLTIHPTACCLRRSTRTPIVTGGSHLTRKEFDNVPADLRAQYTDELFEPSEGLQKILENPELVVDGETFIMAVTLLQHIIHLLFIIYSNLCLQL
jgi:hypothetical protein